jgi:hypothetical protein
MLATKRYTWYESVGIFYLRASDCTSTKLAMPTLNLIHANRCDAGLKTSELTQEMTTGTGAEVISDNKVTCFVSKIFGYGWCTTCKKWFALILRYV